MTRGYALTVVFAIALALSSLCLARSATGESAARARVGGCRHRVTISATVIDFESGVNSASLELHLLERPAEDLAQARLAGDGLVAIRQAVVTAGTNHLGNCFYAQSPQAPVGMRVVVDPASLAEPIEAGYYVAIDGYLLTIDGECQVRATSIGVLRRGTRVPRPLGVTPRALGGGSIGPVMAQRAVGVGSGANNVGLLVRFFGKVTQTGTDYLYVDDGSALTDGTTTIGVPNKGVRVMCGQPRVFRPGHFVTVTGVVSCFVAPSGNLAPKIITRTQADVVRYIER